MLHSNVMIRFLATGTCVSFETFTAPLAVNLSGQFPSGSLFLPSIFKRKGSDVVRRSPENLSCPVSPTEFMFDCLPQGHSRRAKSDRRAATPQRCQEGGPAFARKLRARHESLNPNPEPYKPQAPDSYALHPPLFQFNASSPLPLSSLNSADHQQVFAQRLPIVVGPRCQLPRVL